MEIKPQQVWIMEDSETVLASREKCIGYVTEYYGNRGRLLTTKRRRVMLESGGRVDRPSRVGSKPADVGYGSEWQVSRKFIWMHRPEWPVERNFASVKNMVNIPLDEVNKKCRSMLERNVQSTTISLDELMNMTEVGDETHQECNSMKENMIRPDHVSKPIVQSTTVRLDKLMNMTV